MMEYITNNSPSNFLVTSGCGCSKSSELSAFDDALNDAGIANYNLLKIGGSILPANVKLADCAKLQEELPKGSVLPTVYSTVSSNMIGTIIGTAVAVGVPAVPSDMGIIMVTNYKHPLKFHSPDQLCCCEDEGKEETREWFKWVKEHSEKCVRQSLARTVEVAVKTAMYRRNLFAPAKIITSSTTRLIEISEMTSLISAVCVW